MMFEKLVIIEPINVLPNHIKKLHEFAKEVIYFNNSLPKNDEEIISRIQNADCVLVSYTTSISANVLEHCKNIKYIVMCCSLYSEESANVDIKKA